LKRLGAVLKRHPPPPDFNALLGGENVFDLNTVRESIGKLWTQVALLRVHRANQNILGANSLRQSVPFLSVYSGRCGIQQEVGDGVGKEIDLVDIKHAAVGSFKETGLWNPCTSAHERLSVNGPEQAVFTDTQRHIYKGSGMAGCRRQQGCEPPRERAFCAPTVSQQKRPADARVHCMQEEGALCAFHSDDCGERIKKHGVCV
jgi:hypothetical protein